LQVYVLVHNLP